MAESIPCSPLGGETAPRVCSRRCGKFATLAVQCTSVMFRFTICEPLSLAAGGARGVPDCCRGDYETQNRETGGLQVVGIEVSTNNAKEAGPDGVIGKQWQRFMSDGLAATDSRSRGRQNIYAVYTDYSSDANGEYTFILGAKVGRCRILQSRRHGGETVPAGKYAVFTSERGPVARSWSKPGSKSGRTTNRPQMVSAPIVPISRSTTSAPPIPTTRRWKSTLG